MRRKYYIAYGSNMDLDQMKYRCPDAVFIGTSVVNGYELIFKGSFSGAYATIRKKGSGIVPVLVWSISENDETNLDRYEGYPRFYYKKDLSINLKDKQLKAMVYIMDESRELGSPANHYYKVLEKAYLKFNFDMEILETALEKSKSQVRF